MQSSPGLSFWGLTSLGSFPDVDTHPDITHCRKDQALAQADLPGSSERGCGPWRSRLFVCLLKAMGGVPRICIHHGSTKLSYNFIDVPSLKLVCGPHYEDPAKQRYQNVFRLEELTCLPFPHSQYYPAAFPCCPAFQETCSKMQCCSSAPASKDWGRMELTFRLEVQSLGTIIDSVEHRTSQNSWFPDCQEEMETTSVAFGGCSRLEELSATGSPSAVLDLKHWVCLYPFHGREGWGQGSIAHLPPLAPLVNGRVGIQNYTC